MTKPTPTPRKAALVKYPWDSAPGKCPSGEAWYAVRGIKPKVCSIAECGGRSVGHGLCDKHYRRMKKHGTINIVRHVKMPLPDRIRHSSDGHGPNECWPWPYGRKDSGYGIAHHNGKKMAASRASYILRHGPIKPGLCVLHKCDNPPCVNPNHLFLGTLLDNGKDMAAKCRSRSTRFTPEQVRQIRASGEVPYRLAKRFGVYPSTIIKIIQRKTRKGFA